MKNMKKKKIERRTKEELIKSNKNRRTIIIILVLVVAYFGITAVWNSTIGMINEINSTNESNVDCIESNEGTTVEYVKGFIYGILQLEYPFITKFLIFLGVVYLFNVTITISGDIIQLVLIIGVAIIRFIRWSYRKIKGIEDEE